MSEQAVRPILGNAELRIIVIVAMEPMPFANAIKRDGTAKSQADAIRNRLLREADYVRRNIS